MSIIKHVTLQKIVAHDFRYDLRILHILHIDINYSSYNCCIMLTDVGVQQDGSIVKSDDAVHVEGYMAKVRAIRDVLTRNDMKVAFFGR